MSGKKKAPQPEKPQERHDDDRASIIRENDGQTEAVKVRDTVKSPGKRPTDEGSGESGS